VVGWYRFQENTFTLQLTELEEQTICLIVNTAEYFGTQCDALAEAIKKLVFSSFVSAITLEEEKEAFAGYE
jgi:hypothetical protein